MTLFAHVDEVIHDHAAQVSQSQLPCDFFGRCQIQLVSRLFSGVIRAEAAAVHINRHQGFGLINYDRAAIL